MSTRERRLPLLRRLLTARGRSLEITRAGKLFILLTLAVGFAAINSGSNLLHVVFGMQMAMIIGSGILSEGVVRRVSAARVPTGPLHAGERTPLRVDVHNDDDSRELFSIAVEDDDRGDADSSCDPVFVVRIAPGATVSLRSTIEPIRRGLVRLPRAVVSTRFPFGLFVKRRELGDGSLALVFPRVRLAADPTADEIHSRPDGSSAARPARAGEFHSLREYREGDELRRVHWPATARLQRPVVREDETQGDRELLLDLSDGTTGDASFEDEIEEIASRAVLALGRGHTAVGLRHGGTPVVAPRSGSEQATSILTYLATAGGPWPVEQR